MTIGTVHVPMSSQSCAEDPSDEGTLLLKFVHPPQTYCRGLLVSSCHMSIGTRDRPKFGFGTEDNNLNCFGKFRFPPNIDL